MITRSFSQRPRHSRSATKINMGYPLFGTGLPPANAASGVAASVRCQGGRGSRAVNGPFLAVPSRLHTPDHSSTFGQTLLPELPQSTIRDFAIPCPLLRRMQIFRGDLSAICQPAAGRVLSTVIRNPIAWATAASVAKRGFPRADKAL